MIKFKINRRKFFGLFSAVALTPFISKGETLKSNFDKFLILSKRHKNIDHCYWSGIDAGFSPEEISRFYSFIEFRFINAYRFGREFDQPDYIGNALKMIFVRASNLAKRFHFKNGKEYFNFNGLGQNSFNPENLGGVQYYNIAKILMKGRIEGLI